MSRRPTGRSRRFPVQRVGAAPFAPTDVADIEAWYRGDTTVDVSGVVQTWTDKSGNARDLTQGTAASRPTPATRAGQRALNFDGGDWLRGAFGSLKAQPLSIYAVSELTTGGAVRILYDGDDGTNRVFQFVNTDDTARAAATTQLNGGAMSTAQIYASCFVADSAVSSSFFPRSNFTTATATGNAGLMGLDGITVGASNAGASMWVGYVWEVIVYSGAHDAATRAQIGAYLTARYTGLTVT